MSLMSSLYVGNSGLRASQNALNTTAHNLANVGTKGYTRQQTIITDYKYKTIGGTNVQSHQIGYGTNVAATMTYRNIFMDQNYRDNIGREGYYQAQYEATSEVENLLGETEGVQFQNSIASLWKNMQELAKDPNNIVVRSNFVASCQSFLERSQAVQNQLEKYQQSLNTNILTQVKSINDMGNQIADLNEKISKYESSGVERANDYRDQRDLLLDNLAQLTKITYSENMDGVVSVSIEGTNFVSETGCHELGTAPIKDGSKLIVPTWPHLGGEQVYDLTTGASQSNNTDIGYLKGLLLSRGTEEGNYTDIPVAPKAPERMAGESDTAFAARQTKYTNDLNKYEKQLAVYRSSTQLSSIMTAQAQFDQLIHGVVTKINDTLCPNKEVTITLPGGTTSTFIALDTEKAPVGMDAEHQAGVELFVRDGMDRYEKVTDEHGKVYYKYNEEDPEKDASLYSLNQLSLNQEILSNVSKIPLSNKDNPKEVTMDVAANLVASWKEPFATLTPDNLTPYSINEFYTNFIGEMGNLGNTYKTLMDSQQLAVEGIDSQRQSILGVSSDEELTNIIRYQHAYNASSRYITVVNEMLESLLNNL